MSNNGIGELTEVERRALQMLGRRLNKLAEDVRAAECAHPRWLVETQAAAELCGIIEAAARKRDAVSSAT
jgi:hypothetical protein